MTGFKEACDAYVPVAIYNLILVPGQIAVCGGRSARDTRTASGALG